MISTLTETASACASLGSGPIKRPRRKRQDGNRDDGGHEHGRDPVSQTLHRGAASLRIRHRVHDPRQHRVGADLLGHDHELPALIDRASGHLGARFLGHGHGLARHHGLVHRAPPFDHAAVDRQFLARPHPQAIADDNRVKRHVLLGSIGVQPVGRGRREVEQSADRTAGALARAKLEHLTEQHKDRDHGGGLEVDRDRTIRLAKAGGENVGRNGRDRAVEPRDPGPQRNQREHIERARHDRVPPAHEERPAGPKHHRRREHELEPIGANTATRGRQDRLPSRPRSPARSTRVRSRNGASCPRARRRLRLCRGSAVRAPCRRWGTIRAHRGRPAGASGRCRSRPPRPVWARAGGARNGRRDAPACRDDDRGSCGGPPLPVELMK